MGKLANRVRAALAAALLCLAPAAAVAEEEYVNIIKGANEALKAFQSHPQWQGLLNIFGGTKAILVAPDFASGAFIVGIEQGSGVMLVRHREQWSDPLFVRFEQTSVGFQLGGKESEYLMLVLTRDAVDQYVDGESKVGGSGGFALGLWGVGASSGGGISGGMQTITVSTSEGLSLGGGVADAVMHVRTDLNANAYGDGFNVDKILNSPGGSLPAAETLRATLAGIVHASWHE